MKLDVREAVQTVRITGMNIEPTTILGAKDGDEVRLPPGKHRVRGYDARGKLVQKTTATIEQQE